LGKLLLEAVRRAKDLPLQNLAVDADLPDDLSPDPLLRYQAVELDHIERRLLASISHPVSTNFFSSPTVRCPRNLPPVRSMLCSFSARSSA